MGFGWGKGQELTCGESCMKYLLFLFNVLFFLCGAGLLGVGIWLKVDAKSLEKYFTVIVYEDTNYYDAVAYTLIAVGAFIFLIGFLGCCGACTESKCMLGAYAFLVILIVLIEVVAAILIGVFNSKLQGALKEESAKTMKETAYSAADSETKPDALTSSWNSIQYQLDCCGVNGYMDYRNSAFYNRTNKYVPQACCKPANGTEENNPEAKDYTTCLRDAAQDASSSTASYTQLHSEGCYDKFVEEIRGNLWVVIGICVAVLLFEILAITFACCVMKAI